MKHRRACLLVAVLGCAAALPVMLRASANDPRAGVEIMVNGVSQPKFAQNGRLYVEALKGREYAIRLRNPYPVRVAVALSVDGLNTIDARETTAADARKWVLDPYEIITISGWQTSSTVARRFEFTTEARSYGAALGKTANLGVITAAFFKERVPAPIPYTSNQEWRRRDQSPPAPAAAAPTPEAEQPAAQAAGSAASRSKAADEYAATGMGRRTDHAVTQVWMDLEDTPSQTVNIRYEFRPQLVRLGILSPTPDPLDRRERARGFEDGFSPVPPHLR
jgi:hypothetical protein